MGYKGFNSRVFSVMADNTETDCEHIAIPRVEEKYRSNSSDCPEIFKKIEKIVKNTPRLSSP